MPLEMPSGLIDPISTTPARPTDSVRRTSHIDIERPDGGALVLRGAARDLRTTDGSSTVVAEAQVSARLGARGELVELQTTPAEPRTEGLLGLPVAAGFRAAVNEAVPEDRDAATPLYLLLDELPVAVVISGYAQLYSGDMERQRVDAAEVKADVCSGWRSDGTMMVALRTDGRLPVPVGPTANELEAADDPLGWHDIGPLAPGAMRRRRLVEVTAGEPATVYAMFRDTHVDEGGDETVLHEYSLTANLDADTLALSQCVARPRVLPWVECPAAAASATRLDGQSAADLRRVVGREFRGTSTCTHLNDLMRSLGDLGALVAVLPG